MPPVRWHGSGEACRRASAPAPPLPATGGISVAANTDFRLPKLDVVLRAPAQVGAAVTIGLPGANEAHTGTTGTAASTDLQYLRVSPSNPVQCSSGAEASALTTTTVGNLAPALLPSTTTLEGGQRTLGPNQPTQFTAKVTAEYGTAAVPQGKVVFRDVESNEILGSVNPGADGVAKLDHTFAPVASGQPDQTRQVVAQYAGVDGDIAASTSAPVTVTNTSAPTVFRELGFDVRAQLGVETAQDVPVTINATIVRPAGSVNPSQAMVQLYRGDTPVGAPVALPDGNQMTWTDTVIRQPRTTTQPIPRRIGRTGRRRLREVDEHRTPTGVGDRTRNRPIARPADHRRRQTAHSGIFSAADPS